MKRTIRSYRSAIRLLAISVSLLATTGCLSLPRFSTVSSSSLSSSSLPDVPTGPPVWDDATESEFDAKLPEVALMEDSAPQNADPAHSDMESRGEEEDHLRVAQRENGPRKSRLGRVAGRGPSPKLVEAPEEFQWKTAAVSAGNRDIQTAVIGQGGYRTLLLGSLAGNDPIAINLTERLARHVHENQIVLGGIQLTVIRNLNPDGEANEASENENGIYLNRQISESTMEAAVRSDLPVELQYLFSELEDGQPQRVIHLRTIGRERGVIAYSSGAKSVAGDVVNWVGFQQMELPGRSAEGTLERYLSETDQCQIVTFALPEDITAEDAWDLYSDALLNLLMDEDFATRKLAREQKASKAADRRSRND